MANEPREPLSPVTMPKKAVDREVFLAVAATSSPETDVLAGIVRHLMLLRPNIGTPGLKQSSEAIAASIAQHRPDPARDLSPDDAFRLSRILAAVVPHLTDALLHEDNCEQQPGTDVFWVEGNDLAQQQFVDVG